MVISGNGQTFRCSHHSALRQVTVRARRTHRLQRRDFLFLCNPWCAGLRGNMARQNKPKGMRWGSYKHVVTNWMVSVQGSTLANYTRPFYKREHVLAIFFNRQILLPSARAARYTWLHVPRFNYLAYGVLKRGSHLLRCCSFRGTILTDLSQLPFWCCGQLVPENQGGSGRGLNNIICVSIYKCRVCTQYSGNVGQACADPLQRQLLLLLYFSVSRSPFRQLLGFHLVLRLDLSKGKRLQHSSRAGVTVCLSVSTISETTSTDAHTYTRTQCLCM